jgi:hypothetical protein
MITMATQCVYSHYHLTPVASTTTFGETNARFECDECGHTDLFTGERYFDMYGIRANDHYRGDCRGDCPVRRLVTAHTDFYANH